MLVCLVYGNHRECFFKFTDGKNDLLYSVYTSGCILFVPRQACHEDGLVAIEHNLYDEGKEIRE